MHGVVYLAGCDLPGLAALLLRLVLGVFFLLARFRWVYDPSRPTEPWLNKARHEHMTWRLCTCGYANGHWVLCAFVALVEIFAGVALIVGLLTIPATLGLLAVLLFATLCTAGEKVRAQSPVDDIDCVSCYLWRVEGVYIVVALCILLLGPGAFSLDHLIFGV